MGDMKSTNNSYVKSIRVFQNFFLFFFFYFYIQTKQKHIWIVHICLFSHIFFMKILNTHSLEGSEGEEQLQRMAWQEDGRSEKLC